MRFSAPKTIKSKTNTISKQCLSVFAFEIAEKRIAKRNEIDILSITEAKTKSLRD